MSNPLPEIEVWLRIEPVATPEGLQHAVSLHGEEPEADGTMRYRVRVSPSLVNLPEGQALTYGADISPVGVATTGAPDAFRHARRDSPAARAAAERARAAPADERYDRLLELIGALSG